MRKRLTWFMSAAVLCGMALAQGSSSQGNQATNAAGDNSQPNRVAAGTLIPAELDKSIDAKKCKTGDPIVAKTTSDLLSNGQVVIPRGTKITGHVTAAKAHDKSDPSSSVAIAFDQIAIKNKPPLAFQAEIQAMGRPQQNAAAAATGAAGEPMAGGSGMSAPGAANPGGGSMGRGTASQGGAGASGAPSEATVPQTDAPAQPSSGVALSASSTGVVGMEGISLNAGSDPSQGTVISSANKNVKLDSGTQLILRAK
jgi:hypothetical protein